MELDLVKFTVEVEEFLNAETLRKIDYGILDLSKVKDYELKEVLLYYEELLTSELKSNYMDNDTGIFRVCMIGNMYRYEESGTVIESDSVCELKKLVLEENRIWYVFDDISACKLADIHQ